MIFENEKLSVEIISFTKLHQENVVRHSKGRSFAALSFRFSADTELITEKSSHHVGNKHVCFVPAYVEYDRIAKKDDLIAINCRIKGYEAEDIESFLPKNADKLELLFKKAYDCWTKKEAGYMHRCTAYFYQILAECCAQNAASDKKDSKIQASIDFMNENFTSPDLTLKEIASKSFISEVYFRKIFKEEFGTSPQKHLITLRIQKAVELIETGDFSLNEIALMSGYSDYKYFSSEFKRLNGISPSKYIQK